jgi:hypothetical protein
VRVESLKAIVSLALPSRLKEIASWLALNLDFLAMANLSKMRGVVTL